MHSGCQTSKKSMDEFFQNMFQNLITALQTWRTSKTNWFFWTQVTDLPSLPECLPRVATADRPGWRAGRYCCPARLQVVQFVTPLFVWLNKSGCAAPQYNCRSWYSSGWQDGKADMKITGCALQSWSCFVNKGGAETVFSKTRKALIFKTSTRAIKTLFLFARSKWFSSYPACHQRILPKVQIRIYRSTSNRK